MDNYSVLMSVYHKEKPEFLKQAVSSVMNQTIIPDDFVLVCDGPLTDELNSTISLLQEQYSCLNVIRLKENKGLGEALSIGITHTKNEIVMRMDSDDICLPHRAETQLPYLEKYDLVGGAISEFEDDPNNIIGYRYVPENYNKIIKFAKKRNPFNHPTTMYKKELILKAGNYKTLLYLEDYYLWIRVLMTSDKVYNIQKILVNMRSGREMRARRSNKTARKSIKFLRKYMFENKFINWFSYCWYSMIYGIVLSLPLSFKKNFYKRLHRK